MTAYGEHYAAHWDVNKNPPPAFRADDGIASQRGALQDIQPIDSTEATLAQDFHRATAILTMRSKNRTSSKLAKRRQQKTRKPFGLRILAFC
jgi:hypothetical protein